MASNLRKLSFDIDSAREHVNKLSRELDRLRAADNRVDKSDHAINAAMTAWHLHEWVWAEVKEIERADPHPDKHLDADTKEQLKLQLEGQKRKLAKLRLEIGSTLGIRASDVRADDFGKYMAEKHPPIAICQIIATGSKSPSAKLT